MTTIKEYCEAAYQNAAEHGFHDAESRFTAENPELMQPFELAALARMHSELAEAEDAGDEKATKIPGFFHSTEEFADLLIRIFDWCGSSGYDLQGEYLRQFGSNSLGESVARHPSTDVATLIADCHYTLGMATEDVRKGRNPVARFAKIVGAVNSYHWWHSVDSLDEAIQAKMEYNKSRPYMHGKLS